MGGLIARLAPTLIRLAGDRRSVWLVLGLALAVALPTLDAGLIGDDIPQQRFVAAQLDRSAAAPEPDPRPWWDMFALVDGERSEGLRRAGRYPWWVDLDLRIRFFRPLSVATHYVDRALWPERVWLMHLHSVAWYLLACALVWGLARRLGSSAAVGTVAALWFALCYAHLSPVGWLAHRNATVATVFTLAALWAHHLARAGLARRGGGRAAGLGRGVARGRARRRGLRRVAGLRGGPRPQAPVAGSASLALALRGRHRGLASDLRRPGLRRGGLGGVPRSGWGAARDPRGGA